MIKNDFSLEELKFIEDNYLEVCDTIEVFLETAKFFFETYKKSSDWMKDTREIINLHKIFNDNEMKTPPLNFTMFYILSKIAKCDAKG